MKSNFDLEDYNLIQDNNEKYSRIVVVLVLMLIGIFILLYKFEFQVYEKQTLIKDNDNYFLIVSSNELTYYENEKYIYINKKKYKYDTVSINNNYSNVEGIIYQTMYIKPHDYKTEAIITECYFLRSKETILERIFKFVKGGLG